MYRRVDFKRRKDGVPATVKSIEYDPNRTTRIALIYYADGEKSYILAPVNLSVGDRVQSGPDSEISPGNSLPLRNIPTGTVVHNLELTPGRGGQLVRGAGTGAQVLSREGDYVLIRLPSGEMRRILLNCRASVGQLSNPDHKNESLGKAGARRHLGRRPHVSRRCQEPGGPPPRRRRRSLPHRDARPQVAHRQADPGPQDPQQEEDLQPFYRPRTTLAALDSTIPPRRFAGAPGSYRYHVKISQKGTLRPPQVAEKGQPGSGIRRGHRYPHLVAGLYDYARNGRAELWRP